MKDSGRTLVPRVSVDAGITGDFWNNRPSDGSKSVNAKKLFVGNFLGEKHTFRIVKSLRISLATARIEDFYAFSISTQSLVGKYSSRMLADFSLIVIGDFFSGRCGP